MPEDLLVRGPDAPSRTDYSTNIEFLIASHAWAREKYAGRISELQHVVKDVTTEHYPPLDSGKANAMKQRRQVQDEIAHLNALADDAMSYLIILEHIDTAYHEA